MIKRPDSRETDWNSLKSTGKLVYFQAWQVRQQARQENDLPTDPYTSFKPVKTTVKSDFSQGKKREMPRNRSFDRLYSPLSPLVNSLQPINSFRTSLKSLLQPGFPRCKSVGKSSVMLPGPVTTQDILTYKEDLVPLLKKLAPGSFRLKKRRRTVGISRNQGRNASEKQKMMEVERREVTHHWKWRDKSLLQPCNRRESDGNELKEYEIGLSTSLTRLKRKEEARRKVVRRELA